MLILAIESSCDETACAVVADGVSEVAAELASSAELHHKTGGVVPEVAARKQVEFILPVIESTVNQTAAKLGLAPEQVKEQVDALAVTVGPGLTGSLIVGIEAAKALALAWNKPLLPVNHLVGHIYANFVDGTIIDPFPAVALVASGGHTDLVLIKAHGDIHYLGGTLDDAAGEAFDKVARLLNLGNYLGGANLSQTARNYTGPPLPEKLPRPLLQENNYNFSFSGLKTAVKRLTDKKNYPVGAIAKEFEEAAVEVLVEKTVQAARETKAKTILLGGGVAANQKLRADLVSKAGDGITVKIPPLKLCGDNAVYIASAAYFNQNYQPLEKVIPHPSLTISEP
ncbi:tRNA (adenosine(37)-N6)-threonylcarbamoyltransferase complex transferase subunit TsaD [Patescibacteria group bacterium]|nr:tRNA (adenosine(37)-N6)-threonylcarbamoyltransferase complex transferase subunit TsaD [Patescibacteria group bacterium]MBU1970323.1 tRNA (adenosine(37)-N6)-threonylcarbamoyltransferase complex transferase subunit TsaD [Patescibacteria group bacterium]